MANVLKATPLIDGHNDWAEALRTREGNKRWTIDLSRGLGALPVPYNTDITRLRKAMVGGQFWSVYVSADLPGPEQVKETLEQIDLVKQIVSRYPDTFDLARTAADVRRIHKAGKIASMATALAEWKKSHPAPPVTLRDVADHIVHIANVAGVDHVGLGSDFDGVNNELPTGLEGVSTFPALLAELMRSRRCETLKTVSFAARNT